MRLQSKYTRPPVESRFLPLRIVQSLRYIAVNEGVRALWRGVGPTLLGVTPHRAVYFSTYQSIKAYLEEDDATQSRRRAPWTVHLYSAVCSGLVTSTVLNPIWLVKTRLQLQSNQSPEAAGKNASLVNYRNTFDAVRRIWREEGVRGFYKGMTASYVGVSEGAIHFVLYEKLKGRWRDRHGGQEPSPWVYFLMASGSKFCACIAVYPHEVIRTRLREQRQTAAGKPRKYRNFVQAFHRIAVEEGRAGLYSGMGVHLVRSVPNTAILFVAYEMLVEVLAEWGERRS